MFRHHNPPQSLISQRDSFENNVHRLSSISICLKEITVPDGNDLTYKYQNARFQIKYKFPCYERVSSRLMSEQQCSGQLLNNRKIEFGHQIAVNIDCTGKDDIAELWRTEELKLRLFADGREIGVAKIPLRNLLTYPFSLRQRGFFKSQETRLYPSAQVIIELNSKSQNFMEQLVAVRREILEQDNSHRPLRGRARSASASAMQRRPEEESRPTSRVARPPSVHRVQAERRPLAPRLAPNPPAPQQSNRTSTNSRVSSISDEVFHPPPATPRVIREQIPVYISPMSYAFEVPKIVIPPKEQRYRAVRVKIIRAERLPKSIGNQNEEVPPSTFVTISSKTPLATPVQRNTSQPVWNWSGIAHVEPKDKDIVLRLKHRRADGSEKVLGFAFVDWRRTSAVQQIEMKADFVANARTGALAGAFPILTIQLYEENRERFDDSDVSSVPSETATVLNDRINRNAEKISRMLGN